MNESFIPTPVAAPKTRTSIEPHWTFTRVLLAIGAAGPIVFLVLATLAALLTPGYSMLAQPVSELALGSSGWLQTVNFFLFGLAIIAFAIGFFRSLPHPSWVGTGLLIIVGTGIFAAGIFPTTVKGTPDIDTGGLHNLLFLVIFLALTLSYFFSAFALRPLVSWRGYMWVTALMPLVVFSLLFALIGFGSDIGDPLYAVGGLIQRLLMVVAFGWMTITGWRLLVALPKASARSDL